MASNHSEEPPQRKANGTFEKGHTANRKGRPRGSQNMLTLFNAKRDEKVSLKVNGEVRRMSRLEAFTENLWNKAMALDPKAATLVIGILRATGQLEAEPGDAAEMSNDDTATLQELLARVINRENSDDQ